MTRASINRRAALQFACGAAAFPLASFGPAKTACAQVSQGFVGDLLFAPRQVNGEILFELKDDYGYVDSNGVRWQAKAGVLTDGASIPSVFWPIVGHPYQGLYLNAAVIHDYYCIPKNRYRKWEDVHRVFYDAMLKNGVNSTKATLMYFAVWRFGPRWSVEDIKDCIPNPEKGEYCANATPTAFVVKSNILKAYDTSKESAQLRKVEEQIASGEVKPDQMSQFEANLPPLERTGAQLTVAADSRDGWFFKNPYEFPLR